MKALTILAISVALVGVFAFSLITFQKSAAAEPLVNNGPPQRESPFACDTSALTPEQRKRHFEELGPALRALRKDVRELADGYEFQFPSDGTTFGMLTEWAHQ